MSLRKKSRKTTWAGALTGLAIIAWVASRLAHGEPFDLDDMLALLAALGVTAGGYWQRDDSVTSEQTDARIRRRDTLDADSP